ncbi:MAG: hypothetical protein EP329_25445 [Deltaproteobacteria bacterium]|nr:MAG: hypothetical protein EP329_25445 [Deltaproteobacteria bacterium]
MDIEVQISRNGSIYGDDTFENASQQATCDLCGDTLDAVASIAQDGRGGPYACASCLRDRLEAMSVAKWRFRAAHKVGLPWGKLTG